MWFGSEHTLPCFNFIHNFVFRHRKNIWWDYVICVMQVSWMRTHHCVTSKVVILHSLNTRWYCVPLAKKLSVVVMIIETLCLLHDNKIAFTLILYSIHFQCQSIFLSEKCDAKNCKKRNSIYVPSSKIYSWANFYFVKISCNSVKILPDLSIGLEFFDGKENNFQRKLRRLYFLILDNLFRK